MTAAARIRQDDMSRAAKALAATGLPGRIVMDLQNQRIEIIIGEPANSPDAGPWKDDD